MSVRERQKEGEREKKRTKEKKYKKQKSQNKKKMKSYKTKTSEKKIITFVRYAPHIFLFFFLPHYAILFAFGFMTLLYVYCV